LIIFCIFINLNQFHSIPFYTFAKVNFLPPVVSAPPPEPLDTVEDENFPEGVSETRADDSMGIAINPEDLEDCWNVGRVICSIIFQDLN
jgi:hypothetical protein